MSRLGPMPQGFAKWLGVWAVIVFCACSAYDPALIGEREREGRAGEGSSSGMAGSGSSSDAEVVDSGGTGGGASGSGGTGGGAPDTCVPNPNTADQVCPEICPEQCNGKDDDCDRRIDEEEAHDACARANSDSVCVKATGTCGITKCLNGFRDCDKDADNGCEVAPDDPDHCGLCGRSCEVVAGVAGCEDGQCVRLSCDADVADCDDDPLTCETATTTLVDCGACGSVCENVDNASPSCATGVCGVEQCNAGFEDCDGAPNNGCEQPLNTLTHCGQCDQSCSFPGSQAECATSAGVCQATSCEPGFRECNLNVFDGCESLSSAEHCGGCGVVCAVSAFQNVVSASCSTGSCEIVCSEGWGDCDSDAQTGCETELNSDVNCGECGTVCADVFDNATGICQDGACVLTECDDLFADCTGGAADGCETPTDTLTDCGDCGVTCDKISCAGEVCSEADCSQPPYTTR